MEETTTLAGTPPAETDGTVRLPAYGSPAFYGSQLQDEVGRTKFLKDVVATCRKSPEYGRYRQFLIENLDMSHCSILSGLTDEESRDAGLEIHHAPLDLYSIAELVLGQMEHDEERVTTLSVANKVMAYHWRGMVGLVPVVESVHEMLHANQLKLDPRMVFGDWQGLLRECAHGISEHLAEKLRIMADSWANGDAAEHNARVLGVALQRWIAETPTADMLLEGPDATDEDDN